MVPEKSDLMRLFGGPVKTSLKIDVSKDQIQEISNVGRQKSQLCAIYDFSRDQFQELNETMRETWFPEKSDMMRMWRFAGPKEYEW